MCKEKTSGPVMDRLTEETLNTILILQSVRKLDYMSSFCILATVMSIL